MARCSFVWFAGACAALAACSSSGGVPGPTAGAGGEPGSAVVGATGAVGLELQVAPGVTLNSINYTVTGAGGFSQSGTIDVSMSPNVSALIGGIPAGGGYTITLNGQSTDGSVNCTGASAPFSVTANRTSFLTVALACTGATAEAGTLEVRGSAATCPTIDGISITPASVLVGSSLTLTALARGPNGGALTFSWAATGGSLSGATSQVATFTCGDAGSPVITLTVSDGSDAAGCVAVQSVSVTCTP